MLLWEFLFIVLILLVFWSFFFSVDNIFSLLINSELIIIILFSWSLFSGIFFNLNILFGLSYILLIFGGLELSLSILILLL